MHRSTFNSWQQSHVNKLVSIGGVNGKDWFFVKATMDFTGDQKTCKTYKMLHGRQEFHPYKVKRTLVVIVDVLIDSYDRRLYHTAVYR